MIEDVLGGRKQFVKAALEMLCHGAQKDGTFNGSIISDFGGGGARDNDSLCQESSDKDSYPLATSLCTLDTFAPASSNNSAQP